MSSRDTETAPQINKGFTPKQIKVMVVVGLSYLAIVLVMPFIFNNSPYPAEDETKSIYYSTFFEEPKFLDPARAYSSDEYRFMQITYEPPYAYHYLKRPYQLIPNTAESMPKITRFDKDGNVLPATAPAAEVNRMTFDITIKKGIKYQNHPCFVKNSDGSLKWYLGAKDSFPEIETPYDLDELGTRELTAEDYVYQIKRMANPLISPRPIYSLLERYILGYKELSDELSRAATDERNLRQEAIGAFYNREKDESVNPIWLDMRLFDCPGIKAIDKYTYRITLKKAYPQMLYWLAMQFFSPIPWEATRFYSQKAAIEQNISLKRFPVGTGPYTLTMSTPRWRMEMTRNPNYKRRAFYPTEGEAGDRETGLLKDAGEEVPFIDRIIYVKEREAIPRWQKFQQGYYETSGVGSDVFDQAISITDTGSQLTEDLLARDISLITEVDTTTMYFAFNMQDEVVGGYSEKQKKLRQAIAIVFDTAERLQIFFNGRGMTAHGPIPPGVAGHTPGTVEDFNEVVFRVDKDGEIIRRSIETAQKLLAEAGYENGLDEDGKQLTLYYDTLDGGIGSKLPQRWAVRQFKKLNIDLQIRASDYNRFRHKANEGNWQILSWGWNADYPDPENFLFLLYGPNSKTLSHGENVANYNNPEFNKLFEKMETMSDSPEREAIIKEMLKIYYEDSPWFGEFHTESYMMLHNWIKNFKPSAFSYASVVYSRVDQDLRAKKRAEWNRPVTWPIAILIGVMIATILPGLLRQIRKEEEGA